MQVHSTVRAALEAWEAEPVSDIAFYHAIREAIAHLTPPAFRQLYEAAQREHELIEDVALRVLCGRRTFSEDNREQPRGQA